MHFEPKQLILPFVYIAIAVVFYFVINKVVKITFTHSKDKLTQKQQQRVRTLKAMVMSIVKYIAVVAVALAILANFGVDISSLLAGLGIVTAIVGLAFQDLGKDIIAGISIITEGQYEVGDLIEVGDFRGRVTSVGLKTTRIKNYRGKVKIISNRNMSEVVNYSKFDTLAEVRFQAPYEVDPDKVMGILEGVKKNLDGKMEQMTGEIKLFTVSAFEDNGMTYRITCPCQPYKHFAVQRAIRREIVHEFRKNKIEIPYTQIEIHEN